PGARAAGPDRLRQLRGVPGRGPLPLRGRGPGLPLALLLALPPPLVAAGLALARAPDPGVPARLPRHLLLLPQGLLPLVLRRPLRLRGGGGALEGLLRRGQVPVRAPEPPPLLPLRGDGPAGLPVERRGARVRHRRPVRRGGGL